MFSSTPKSPECHYTSTGLASALVGDGKESYTTSATDLLALASMKNAANCDTLM